MYNYILSSSLSRSLSLSLSVIQLLLVSFFLSFPHTCCFFLTLSLSLLLTGLKRVLRKNLKFRMLFDRRRHRTKQFERWWIGKSLTPSRKIEMNFGPDIWRQTCWSSASGSSEVFHPNYRIYNKPSFFLDEPSWQLASGPVWAGKSAS